MPIIGHALAGVAIGQQFGPADLTRPARAGIVARALWVPTIVSLSYLPDVLTQVGVWVGFAWAQAAGHSMPAGCAIGLLVGLVWARLIGARPLRMAALATGAILLHDVMDLFQDHERMPFWPLSTMEIGRDWLMFPDRLTGELLVFGLPFVVYQVWRMARGRGATAAPPTPAVVRWTAAAFVAVVLLVSLGVVHLRNEREAQLDRAEDLLRAGQLSDALASIDAAERWPSSAGDGDLLRGRVYARMRDSAQAEAIFLRAHRNDPDNFWTVAALAEFYASRGPADVRRTRSAPYVERLRREFAREESFPRVMERIAWNLAQDRDDE